MAILNTSGQAVVEYTYDAWGNYRVPTGSMKDTLGQINPLRYRGYVYDRETRLYYLQSRYYDPEIGRFISADALISTGQGILGNNMFAYCGNNPVNYVDPTGNLFWSIVGIAVITGLILCVPSSENQEPQIKQAAKEKYNSSTVNVYRRDNGSPVDDKLNVEVYVANEEKDFLNIQIKDSLTITSTYEMNAVLEVVMESEHYSEERFGSRSFMAAQWVAHNECNNIASGSSLGYRLMSRLSGSSNPIESSKVLDIRNLGNMGRASEIIYSVISWAIP